MIRDRIVCTSQPRAIMRRLSLVVTCATALLFVLSSARATDSGESQEEELQEEEQQEEEQQEQRFISFEDYPKKVQAGSIINVPKQCPPDKVKVGNRCRSVF